MPTCFICLQTNKNKIKPISLQLCEKPCACDGQVHTECINAWFKKEHFEELYPEYKIHYIYCLSEWFKKKDYTSELKYCKKYNIPVYWGNDLNYQ